MDKAGLKKLLLSPGPGFASRVGRLGFFLILVNVSLAPGALFLFDTSLVVGKRTFIHDYCYNRW